MSTTDDLLKLMERFINESRASPRMNSAVTAVRHAAETLQSIGDSPGMRASKQAETRGDKYMQHKQMTFNATGQEPGPPSEAPGSVEDAPTVGARRKGRRR